MLEEGDDEEPEDGPVEVEVAVWPENLEVADLFVRKLGTQWIRDHGYRVALDYKAAHAELDGMRVLDHDPYMDDLRVMELAALEVFAEQAQRDLDKMRRRIDADRESVRQASRRR